MANLSSAAAVIAWNEPGSTRQHCITGVAGRFKFIQADSPTNAGSTKKPNGMKTTPQSGMKSTHEVFLTVDHTTVGTPTRLVFAIPPTGYPRLLNDPSELLGAVVLFERGESTFAAKYEQAVTHGAVCVLVGNDAAEYPWAVISVAGQVRSGSRAVLKLVDVRCWGLLLILAIPACGELL